MSVAWSWSLRAIRAIQILAEEWLSQSEGCDALGPTLGTSHLRPNPVIAATASAGSTGTNESSEPSFPGPPALPDDNLDWLFDVDTGNTLADLPSAFINWDQDPLWKTALGFEHIPHFDPAGI
jgi:hypothetical protein